MTCPDLDRLIDCLVLEEESDRRLEDHLLRCESCRGNAFLMQELLGSVFEPAAEVPEDLLQRTVASLPKEPGRLKERHHPSTLQLAASGVLGLLTASSSLLASGVAGVSGPMTSLLVALLVGCGAAVLRARPPWTPEQAP